MCISLSFSLSLSVSLSPSLCIYTYIHTYKVVFNPRSSAGAYATPGPLRRPISPALSNNAH